MGDRPLVSVVAVCFNHARFVRDCLDAIAAQDHPNTEVLIIDDASTDDSVATIRQWLRDTGFAAELVVHERNQGICATRNDALRRVHGDYLAFVSTDDAWLPGKLSAQVALMEALPSHVAVVYGDAVHMDETGRALDGSWLRDARMRTPPSGDVYEPLLRRVFVPSLTTLVRREAIDAVGGYDEALSFEDWDMWLRLAARYHFAYAPGPWARYRIVAGSLGRSIGPAYWSTIATLMHKQLGARPALDPIAVRWIRRCMVELAMLGADTEVDRWLAVLDRTDRSRVGRAVRAAVRSGVVGPRLLAVKSALRPAVRAVRAAPARQPVT